MKKQIMVLMGGMTLLLAGCASVPTGPSVLVMPKPGKPFDLFQQEDMQCRGYAQQSIGVNPQGAQVQSFAGTAVAGAAVGALVGALAHNAGAGAAVGLGLGSVVGAGSSQDTGLSLQQRYDNTYQQCMYSKGNQIMPQTRVNYYPGYYSPGYW